VAAVIGASWSEHAMVAASAAVIVGHMFPVWLMFRGGKAVATALGVLAVVAWPVALVAALIWLAMAILFRYSSLAALVASAAAAAYSGFVVDGERALLIALIALAIIAKHHENIRRLIAGTESRISFTKS
jgi:glycerol-3-phosphate acyltransferase PlsY